MVLKLDMKKAYDRVNWYFLDGVLEKIGFEAKWREWVMECITTPKFLVLVDGEQSGYFNSKKGLQYGDPISPYLFIIMIEALGRTIKQAQLEGNLIGSRPTRACEPITHHHFFDDTILIG